MAQPDFAFDENGALIREFQLMTGNRIIFAASNLHSSTSGRKALVEIRFALGQGESQILAFGDIKLADDEDRRRIALSAYKHLAPPKQESRFAMDIAEWTESVHRHALDLFCYDVPAVFDSHTSVIDFTLGEEITCLDHVLKPYIIAGGGTILYGPKGSGKTMLGLLMARSIEMGDSRFWEVPRPRRQLFVQLERSGVTFGRRIQLVNRIFGLPISTPLLTLLGRGRSLSDIRRQIEHHVKEDGVEVVILDSLSRTSEGGSLVHDDTANSIMDALNEIAPAYLALGHTSHEGKENARTAHVFGSVHFENAADALVQVTAQRGKKNLMGLLLQVVDANDFAPGYRETFAMIFDELGLSGFRRAGDQEFPELMLAEHQNRTERIRAYLADAGASSGTAISSATGIHVSDVLKVLKDRDEFVFVRQEGKDRLYGVKDWER